MPRTGLARLTCNREVDFYCVEETCRDPGKLTPARLIQSGPKRNTGLCAITVPSCKQPNKLSQLQNTQLNLLTVTLVQVSFGQRLVSAKTRSSGIINNLVPRAHVSFSFFLKFDTAVLSKPNSTFPAFPVRIECLCRTHPHRLYI